MKADKLPRTGGLHKDFSRLVQPNIPFPDSWRLGR